MALIPVPAQISPSSSSSSFLAHLLRQNCWRRYVVRRRRESLDLKSALAIWEGTSIIDRQNRMSTKFKTRARREWADGAPECFELFLTRPSLRCPLSFFQNAEFGDMSDVMTTTMPGKNEEPLKSPLSAPLPSSSLSPAPTLKSSVKSVQYTLPPVSCDLSRVCLRYCPGLRVSDLVSFLSTPPPPPSFSTCNYSSFTLSVGFCHGRGRRRRTAET